MWQAGAWELAWLPNRAYTRRSPDGYLAARTYGELAGLPAVPD